MKAPFKVGTTSYIYPDAIVSNVRQLKGWIDDIELVLFEGNDRNNMPSRKDLIELNQLAVENALSYTVHLPLDLDFGSPSGKKRQEAVKKASSLIKHMSRVDPFAYLIHLNALVPPPIEQAEWRSWCDESMKKILQTTGVESHRLAIENLNYPFNFVSSIVGRNKLSVCIDIGHLVLGKVDVRNYLTKYLAQTRVIHLHGVNVDRDHVSLKYFDRVLLRDIMRLLIDNDYQGILTLEVFSQNDFEESMEVLGEAMGSFKVLWAS